MAFLLFPSHAFSESLPETQGVTAVYEKGKQHYDEGDYPAALAEWDKLEGKTDATPAFRKMIDYLRGRAKNISKEDVREVDRQLEALARQRSAQTAVLDSFGQLTDEASQKLEVQTTAMEEAKAASEKHLSDKEAALLASFEKGKALYKEGLFEEAKTEWKLLADSLEDPSKLLHYINRLEAIHRQSLALQKMEDQINLGIDPKVKMPESLAKAIDENQPKLRDE